MGKLKLCFQYLTVLDVLPFVIYQVTFTFSPILISMIIFLFPYNVTHMLSDMGDSGFSCPCMLCLSL